MVEDTEQWLLCRVGLLVGDVGCHLRWLSKDRGSDSCCAEGVGIVHHVDGDVPHLCFSAIVPDFEGDVSGWHILPEFVKKSQMRLHMMGVWCSRSRSSSALAHCLSSMHSSSGWAYLHSGPHLTFSLCLVFVLRHKTADSIFIYYLVYYYCSVT